MSRGSAYLSDLTETLWPGSAPSGGSALPRSAARDYLPLPSGREPRLLVPAANPRAAARGVAAFTARHSSRVRSALVGAAFASGLAPLLLRDRIRVAAGGGIEDALSASLGRELAVAVHLGPPRANRKPVLLLLSPEGHAVGYAKIGVNPLTARLVEAETAALRTLARAHLPEVAVPRLLHTGLWSGRPFLVQEALPIGNRTRRPSQRQLLRCVTQIAGIDGPARRSLTGSDYYRRLLSAVEGLGAHPCMTQLRTALHRLPDIWLTFGAWHGDLTRWNLASTPQRDFVWDWERLAPQTPLGFDALHYELNESLHRGLESGVRDWLRTGAGLLRDPMLTKQGLCPRPQTVHTTMALYLIELATRYLHDRQDEAGGRRAAVGEWLLPALAELVDNATREPAT